MSLMSEQTQKRSIAFIRTVAGKCAECNRHGSQCDNCISVWAKSIYIDITADMGREERPDLSFGARSRAIISALESAGHPLFSDEIHIDCTSQLKWWTLRTLVKRGTLGSSMRKKPNGRGFAYCYHLK